MLLPPRLKSIQKDKIWQTADSANNNSDPLVREHLTNSAALNLFEYQKTFPDNIEVFVTDIHGALVGTTNRTSDYYQADETWWQAAYNNGQGAVYISDPQLDESTGKLGIQFALPLRNHSTGTIIGILRTTYLLTPLNAVLQAEIGETSETDMFIPGEPLIQIQDGELETPVPELFKQLQSAGQGMLEMDYEASLALLLRRRSNHYQVIRRSIIWAGLWRFTNIGMKLLLRSTHKFKASSS